MQRLPTSCLFLVFLATLGVAQEPTFQPLFNGRDLEGWVRVNTDPSTWSVQDGMLICSGKPIGELRTTRMYQNFILEVEWRHMKPRGNAGIFVWADDITAKGVPFHRSIEVQVLENAYGNTATYSTHGDIFPIHGASMVPVNGRGGSRAFPTENRSKPSPEWNHYRIECRDGDISLAVNGKVVTRGRQCTPRKGYICIESEGGVAHYRNMRIQELPDSPLPEDQVAIRDRGYRCLYTGIDLDDWNASEHWRPRDWELQSAGEGVASLATKEAFTDVGFIFDFKSDTDHGQIDFSVSDASASLTVDDKNWHRVEGTWTRGKLSYSLDGGDVVDAELAARTSGPLQWKTRPPTRLANIYVRDLNESKIEREPVQPNE